MAIVNANVTGTLATPSPEETSSVGTPVEKMTDIVVTGDWEAGYVNLEERNPAETTEWSVVWSTLKNDAKVLLTPNTAIQYRWRTEGIVGTVNAHFGETV